MIMNNQIIKYEETYLVTYKDWSTEEISKQWWEILNKLLWEKQWVVVNWNGYDRYEIKSCKKITRDGEAMWLLKDQLQVVQDKVKEYIEKDTKEMTPGRMMEMIRVAKDELKKY